MNYFLIKLLKRIKWFQTQISLGTKTGEKTGSEDPVGIAQGFLEHFVPESKEVLRNWLEHVQRHWNLKVSSLVKYGTIQESKIKEIVITVNTDTKDKKQKLRQK